MERLKIELYRGLRIFKSRYPVYLLILIIGFLLQRSVLLDIPMSNEEGRLPLKITNYNITINALFHSFVLVFCIYLIEIFYRECFN
tara:strand:- start:128 stop:385 length:258 start_codon:yes stop_codon:yes gene_type:complete